MSTAVSLDQSAICKDSQVDSATSRKTLHANRTWDVAEKTFAAAVTAVVLAIITGPIVGFSTYLLADAVGLAGIATVILSWSITGLTSALAGIFSQRIAYGKQTNHSRVPELESRIARLESALKTRIEVASSQIAEGEAVSGDETLQRCQAYWKQTDQNIARCDQLLKQM